MNENTRPDFDRLNELLIDRATIGLPEDQQQEFNQLMDALGFEDDPSFELTAAAVDLAVGQEEFTPMPTHLRQQLVSRAEVMVPSSSSSPAQSQQSPPSAGWRMRDTLGLLAIAASLIFAAFVLVGASPDDLGSFREGPTRASLGNIAT